MKDENKLVIGVPNGSLVDPKRGGLKEILDKARIYIDNIGSNKPLEVTNIPWLEARVGRPQELPALAKQGYCDIFFCGDDWAKEWELRGIKSEKMLGLGIGKADIVTAIKEDSCKALVRIASEYPYLARDFFFPTAPIINIGDEMPVKEGVVIITSYGITEAKAYYDLADIVVDVAQSGDTLRRYGMTIKSSIMASECSLYISERIKDDEWKMKKTNRIKMMLEGAINANDKDLAIFNVKNENLNRVLDYIRQNHLFANEETSVKGKTFSEITLELSTTDRQKPLIDILGDLKELGASSIEGVPLSYSIR